MRKHLFVALLMSQLIIILVVLGIFSPIEKYGKPFQVLATPSPFTYGEPLSGDVQLDYDFLFASKEQIESQQEFFYNEAVYILLTENDEGIYELTSISDKAFKQINDNQITFQSQYSYYNETDERHELRVPFQLVKQIRDYGEFRLHDKLLVTIYKGFFGQYKITKVEKYE